MRNTTRLVAIIIGVALTGAVSTAPVLATDLTRCFIGAGQMYGVSPSLLRAIAYVESTYHPQARNLNSDGSEDLGLMQINSWWLPKLAPYGINREMLLSDACTNVHIGAWILSQEIQQLGPSWRAVGAYNAKSSDKARRYARRVFEVFRAQGGVVRSAPRIEAPSPVQPKLNSR